MWLSNISDSCEPAIIPDVTCQTVDGKNIIVVDVEAGRQRPYYIKSLGLEQGVFVRVAGTTRQADEYMLRELMFEGSNRSFDQTVCLGLEVTEQELIEFCKSLQEVALQNTQTEEEKRMVKEVTLSQLVSWGILLEKDGKFLPTNAYAVLAGKEKLPVSIQCGLFKGTSKDVFLDRREFTGTAWEQLEQAYQFVLRNIRLGAVMDGLYRQDVYEIPTKAIRELIINAVVHRSYVEHNSIQIAIYDDRLEVTSPGKLPMGQTIEKMKKGYSKIRNEALARAFSYMRLIEHWGSGIPRVIGVVKSAGLKEPEFIDGDIDLRVNLYRNQDQNGITDTKPDTKLNDLSDNGSNAENQLLEFISSKPNCTQKECAASIGVSIPTMKRLFAKLQEEGRLEREGTNRKGKWIIKK